MHLVKSITEIGRLTDDQLDREIAVWQTACEDSVVSVWINQADERRNKLLSEKRRRTRR
jgi:hypothetical protein